jgi:hypothetical protein
VWARCWPASCRGRVVFVSVVLHGIAATPVMRLLDHFNERTQPSPSVTETP